jgi:alpha-1,3/alpha-1,6-mannosyltransferase
VKYHKELESLAESLGLNTCTARTIPTALGVSSSVEVLFLLSVSSAFKHTLLQNATLLVYTPTNEHFGIVPVEAMQMGVPVLAANTGGPLETVEEGRTGWLRDAAKSEQWTEIMRKVIQDLTPEQRRTMGESGKKKVEREFSRTVMAERLDGVLDDMFDAARPRFVERRDILLSLGVCGAMGAALLAFITKPKLRLEPPPRPKQY